MAAPKDPARRLSSQGNADIIRAAKFRPASACSRAGVSGASPLRDVREKNHANSARGEIAAPVAATISQNRPT